MQPYGTRMHGDSNKNCIECKDVHLYVKERERERGETEEGKVRKEGESAFTNLNNSSDALSKLWSSTLCSSVFKLWSHVLQESYDTEPSICRIIAAIGITHICVSISWVKFKIFSKCGDKFIDEVTTTT